MSSYACEVELASMQSRATLVMCLVQQMFFFFLVMGRRWLLFDPQKNQERKKHGLYVKIPLEVLRPSELVV